MKQKSADLKKLFNEKKYSEIVDIIQNNIGTEDKNAGLLNLLGVCRLLEKSNTTTLKLAIKDFKEAYLKEKNTPNAIHALKNFINASVDLFDYEFRYEEKNLHEEYFGEIFLYLNESKDFFEKNEELCKSIVRVYKRNLDLDKTIYYLKKIIDINPNNTDALSSYIYFNNFKKDWDQKKFLQFAKILDKKLILYSNVDLIQLEKSSDKKINLAFLSSDLRANHSVSYFLRTVLLEYDKEKFNIILYINNKKEDKTTEEFKKYVSLSRNISDKNDIEAINIIRSDRIDIIIDLMGFTSNHRLSLFKNRIAQKQILWCGYCGTSGISEMDYIVSDKNLIHNNEKNLYSEKIIFLDNIWNSHPGFITERKLSSIPFSKNKYITFGSFNNFRKINDNVIYVWSSILKQVSKSRLILKTSDVASISVLAEKFKKNGVLDSVKFQPYKKSLDEHLNEYNKIDIALDTFPYNGVTTSFEAIWMGVPVLTMKGYNFNSRCGESININMKLVDLIALDENDYINKAKDYALDIKKLSNLRNKIYHNALASPLFDKKKFSNQFFTSLEKIYN